MQLIQTLTRRISNIFNASRRGARTYNPPSPCYKKDVEWVKSIMLFYHFDYEKINQHLQQYYASMTSVRVRMLETAVKELKDIPQFGGRIALKCETPDFRIRVLGIRVPVVSKLRTLSK